jgi:hypothetical protein
MIYEKLANIQAELFVPKGQKNDFGGYNYRSCEDILKMAKPLCQKYGCVLLLDSSVEVVDGKTHIIAIAKVHDLDDGSEISSTAGAREEEVKKGMDGSQISGAALSYARKYALAGLFCIDNERDSDVTNVGISKKEQTLLLKIWTDHGGTADSLCKHCHVEAVEHISSAQYAKVMEQLREKDGK